MSESRLMFCTAVGPWHRWFAWRPVNTVTHGWRWLRYVERQRVQSKVSLPGPLVSFWDYRTEQEGKNDE